MSDCTPFTQAGYVGEDAEVCVHRLLAACDWDVRRAEMGIIHLDEFDKLARRPENSPSGKDVSGEGVQQSLLKLLEGTTIHISDRMRIDRTRVGLPTNSAAPPSTAPAKGETLTVDTSNILFILSGAFVGLDKVISNRVAKSSIGFGAHIAEDDAFFTSNDTLQNPLSLVETQDLMIYGMIPEILGRIPILASLDALSQQDLLRVLTEPKNALLKQYEQLFALSGVELRFTTKALREIARLAVEKGTGARGLRRIMEDMLTDAMFEVPGSGVRYCLVTEDVAKGQTPTIYLSRGQQHLFHSQWQAEETQWEESLVEEEESSGKEAYGP